VLLGAACFASACASSGAVPRPFPIPGTAAPAAPRSLPSQAEDQPAAAVAPDLYALAGTALALRGTPYRNGGADPSGFDCSGFTQYVFGQYGIGLPRAVHDQFQVGTPIDASQLEPGDLIFFATTAPDASHVGIALGGDQFVHAPSSNGVVRVERLSSTYWSQRFIGARRVSQSANQH
jgi:cell wall-associated NlpC family hydrolase